MAHALSSAAAHHVHKVVAEVPAHNQAAIGLLLDAGFAEEGYLVNHFRRQSGVLDDAVLLSRATA